MKKIFLIIIFLLVTNNLFANTLEYKDDTTNEIFGALGYLAKIDLFKSTNNQSKHFLSPKALFRYSPDHMRKETETVRLSHLNIFSLDRLNTSSNFESGSNVTVGFDYKFKNLNKELDFSLGQTINAKENKSIKVDYEDEIIKGVRI